MQYLISPIVFVAGDSSMTMTFSLTGVLLFEPVCFRGDRRKEALDGPGAVGVVRFRFFFNIDGVSLRGLVPFRLWREGGSSTFIFFVTINMFNGIDFPRKKKTNENTMYNQYC